MATTVIRSLYSFLVVLVVFACLVACSSSEDHLRAKSGHLEASDVPARGGEGVVARYDAERGFGFIAPDAGGADLFVHVSVLRGTEALHQGDRVRYQVRQSDRGPQADRVERV